jgi:hypothetical protein
MVMLPTSSLPKWRGCFGASEVGVGAPPAGTADGGTDYDWACSVNDLIGILPFYGDVAVILDDHPLRTTWRQISSSEGVVARPFVANQPDDVLSRIVSGLDDVDRRRLLTPDDEIDQMSRDSSASPAADEHANAMRRWARSGSACLRTDFLAGDYTIFDSVDEGTDVRQSLVLRLDPGLYEVLSGWHRFDRENVLVLHWIKLIERG